MAPDREQFPRGDGTEFRLREIERRVTTLEAMRLEGRADVSANEIVGLNRAIDELKRDVREELKTLSEEVKNLKRIALGLVMLLLSSAIVLVLTGSPNSLP